MFSQMPTSGRVRCIQSTRRVSGCTQTSSVLALLVQKIRSRCSKSSCSSVGQSWTAFASNRPGHATCSRLACARAFRVGIPAQDTTSARRSNNRGSKNRGPEPGRSLTSGRLDSDLNRPRHRAGLRQLSATTQKAVRAMLPRKTQVSVGTPHRAKAQAQAPEGISVLSHGMGGWENRKPDLKPKWPCGSCIKEHASQSLLNASRTLPHAHRQRQSLLPRGAADADPPGLQNRSTAGGKTDGSRRAGTEGSEYLSQVISRC